MKYLIPIFFFVHSLSVASAQNEQRIRDIKKYIIEIDSLIENCRDCFDSINQRHLLDNTETFSGNRHAFVKRHNGRGMREVVDSLMRNSRSGSAWRFSHYSRTDQMPESYRKIIEELFPIILVIEERHHRSFWIRYNERKYYQNNKLVAVLKEYTARIVRLERTKKRWRPFRGKRYAYTTRRDVRTGRVMLYINDGRIIYYEKIEKERTRDIDIDIESMAQRHNLILP